MKNLIDYTNKELEKELERRGFQTDNLWQIADVENEIDCRNELRAQPIVITDSQKMNILIEALTGDGVMSAINEAISDIIDERFPDENDESLTEEL